jgi:hypothetical protein
MWDDALDISTVWPSGAEAATNAAATAVAPPGLFNTTIGWPSTSDIGVIMVRASTSAGPPAA